MADKAAIAIFIVLILVLVGYAIFIFITYSKKKFIFAPYEQPPLMANQFHPLVNVIPLTPDQQEARKQAYTRAP